MRVNAHGGAFAAFVDTHLACGRPAGDAIRPAAGSAWRTPERIPTEIRREVDAFFDMVMTAPKRPGRAAARRGRRARCADPAHLARLLVREADGTLATLTMAVTAPEISATDVVAPEWRAQLHAGFRDAAAARGADVVALLYLQHFDPPWVEDDDYVVAGVFELAAPGIAYQALISLLSDTAPEGGRLRTSWTPLGCDSAIVDGLFATEMLEP
jgi:hypothetical protein